MYPLQSPFFSFFFLVTDLFTLLSLEAHCAVWLSWYNINNEIQFQTTVDAFYQNPDQILEIFLSITSTFSNMLSGI